MQRLGGKEKAYHEYTQQNNAMVKTLETKIGQLVGQL